MARLCATTGLVQDTTFIKSNFQPDNHISSRRVSTAQRMMHVRNHVIDTGTIYPSPLIFYAVLDKGLLAFLRCASKIPLLARVHVMQLRMESEMEQRK
jgi:hypothetical protein